ncbi:hypothetical protein IY145_17190 [Methylosinus sp. H3A]|uniref:hypothetical protein n=1 Tax=Methylosinus sp. H3A TaxID=2785786 RepID=UPI0018C27077|nr:hypothetical protein [Methylosinus sp. H3A]MBG0811109.1 hypothetical protein [Methylosinus sp. H3A]
MSKNALAAGLLALTLTGSTILASTAEANPYRRHHHGHYWGGVAAAGALTALTLGAIAASQAPSDCYMTRQPVTDDWGNVLYFRRVRVCE